MKHNVYFDFEFLEDTKFPILVIHSDDEIICKINTRLISPKDVAFLVGKFNYTEFLKYLPKVYKESFVYFHSILVSAKKISKDINMEKFIKKFKDFKSYKSINKEMAHTKATFKEVLNYRVNIETEVFPFLRNKFESLESKINVKKLSNYSFKKNKPILLQI